MIFDRHSKPIAVVLVCLISVIALGPTWPVGARAAVPDELKRAIEEKSKGLETITKQILETQQQLWETEEKGKTLNSEIKRLDYTMSRLGLDIRAGEITVDKLGLEISALDFDIREKEDALALRRAAIVGLLRTLQEQEHESSLVVFLKGKSLAESLLEAQSAASVNETLGEEVYALETLRGELAVAFSETSAKKAKVDSETRGLKHRKDIVDDQRVERRTLLAQTKDQEKLYQRQLTELERQQEAIADEIEKIEDELRRNFDPSLLPSKHPGVFTWPVTLKDFGGKGKISQHYGERSWLYRGKPHNGLDVAAPIGTEVVVAEDGVVLAVDNNDLSSWKKYQYGKYVLVEHANNLTTLYGHLSGQIVKIGDRVTRGQVIGYVGNTGYSTGPHVHFGLYWSPSVVFKSVPPAAGLVPVGVLTNPEDYL